MTIGVCNELANEDPVFLDGDVGIPVIGGGLCFLCKCFLPLSPEFQAAVFAPCSRLILLLLVPALDPVSLLLLSELELLVFLEL